MSEHLEPKTNTLATLNLAGKTLSETTEILKSDGPLLKGQGLVSGVIAFGLAFLCLLGVIAFHFPEYLTTPELRKHYSPDFLRYVMFAAMVLSGSIGLLNVLMGRRRAFNLASLGLLTVALALGGTHVPVDDFPDHTPYIGLDWFILDLLGSTTIFVLIEKLFPLRPAQHLFRKAWQTDLVHFAVNHFLVGLTLLAVNFLVHKLFGWAVKDSFQNFVQSIWFVPQLVLCILVADLVQYWLHRAYHEVPLLWRIHGVHHSAEVMDWLAGSRQHMLELIATRVFVLGALYVFGFNKAVMDCYILIVGFQAVFNHANVKLRWGFLRHVIVTPEFHHWHHASDSIAIDKNYSAHFSFLDRLFGTDIKNQQGFPNAYGVVGDYMPEGFIKQQLSPFVSLPGRDTPKV